MNVFPFIEAEKAEQRNVAKACEMLEVSRSAFYEWHQHIPSAREQADAELGERIQEIFDESAWQAALSNPQLPVTHLSAGTQSTPQILGLTRFDGHP